MSAARRRWLILAAVVGALGLAGYAALWREGAKILRQSIAAWAEDQRSAGVEVEFANVETTGFPFILRGVVKDAAIAQGGAWRWSADRLYVDAAPWTPDRLTFSPGTQTVDLAQFGRWRIESTSGRAVVAVDRTSGWRLRIKSGPGSLSNESGAFKVRSKRFDALIAPEDGAEKVRATIAVADVAIEGRTRPVEASTLEFDFEVADPPGGGPREFRVHRFALEGEGGSVLFSGAFTIDAAGYPQGDLYADIGNPGVFAAALFELGALSKEDADAASAMLSLAAIAVGGRIAAPLVFKEGKASIAGVPVGKLPKID